MDKLDKGALTKAKGVKFWSSLVLTAASGLIMLQAPLVHADAPAAAVDTTEVSKQVTFYVQPVYQPETNSDWQAIPGVEPIKMTGHVGQTFQAPVYNNFVPTGNISQPVPSSGADLKHPRLLKYRQQSTGQYTATVNINYVNHRSGTTLESDTKTLHYADKVTIRPKNIQGYQPVEASFKSPYFTKNNDQSVDFLFRELRDLTCLVEFLYEPVTAFQANQPEKHKEPQPNQAPEVSATNSQAGSDSKIAQAHNQRAQAKGDSKPASSKVTPVTPDKTPDHSPKGEPKNDSKVPAVDNQAPAVNKEVSSDAVKPKASNPVATQPVSPIVQKTASVIPSHTLAATTVRATKPNQLPASQPAFATPLPSQPVVSTQSTGTVGNFSPAIRPMSAAHDHLTKATGNKKTAAKGMAVYAIKTVALYRSPNFNPANQRFRYPAQKRYARPMFVVTGYARSESGKLRYRVRDVNHRSRSHGTTGYLTANWAYVRPVYYGSHHRKIKVINPTGVHAYQDKNLTGKVRSYKSGRIVSVKGITHYHLTTRFILADGSYITANRKLVRVFK